MRVRYVADRALFQQPANHRTAERAGSAGHNDMPALKYFRHPGPLLSYFYDFVACCAAPTRSVAPFGRSLN
jgi:hypothetical protein